MDENTTVACMVTSAVGIFLINVIKATKTAELTMNNGTTLKRAKKQARWIGCQLGYIESHLGQRLEDISCIILNLLSKIFTLLFLSC